MDGAQSFRADGDLPLDLRASVGRNNLVRSSRQLRQEPGAFRRGVYQRLALVVGDGDPDIAQVIACLQRCLLYTSRCV